MDRTEFEDRMHACVREERTACLAVLSLICEAEATNHAVATGFADLYDWLERKHKYSHPAACRRIHVARLLREVPEVGEKLRSGTVNLTTMSMLQSALRRDERVNEREYGPEARRAWVTKLEGKTCEQTAELLAAAFPQTSTRKAYVQAFNAFEDKVVLILPREAVADLRRSRELLSHQFPHANLADVVAYLAKEYVKSKAPEQKEPKKERKPRNESEQCVNVSSAMRERVLREANGRCEFRDEKTGQRCGSLWQVEVDHIRPRAAGGTSERENLRCLCRKHNQHAWEEFQKRENSYAPEGDSPAH